MNELRRERSAVGAKSVIAIILAITIVVILLSVGSTWFFDDKCHTEAETWLHIYPGSEVVEETFTYLRMFGIGKSRRVLYTPDDSAQVRVWYNEENQRASDEHDGVMPTLYSTFSNSIRSAPDDNGTLIIQSQECYRELDFSSLGISNAG